MAVALPVWPQSMREIIGPGDTVRVSTYRHPELTTEARLSDRGELGVPLVGQVTLKGLTPDQAAKLIADKLKRGNFLVDPQIIVRVIEARSRQISILGYVKNPGRYVLDGSAAKISDVIAMAGGLEISGSNKIIIQRSEAGKTQTVNVDLLSIIEGDSSKNVEVHGGDSVFVPRAAIVYVYGEVMKGGAYRIEPNMTVMQAISLAGGITPRGSESRVQLRHRASDGHWKESSAKLTDQVAPDDVVYVRESLF